MDRQVELAEATGSPPFAEETANRTNRLSFHDRGSGLHDIMLRPARAAFPLPPM